MSESPAPQSQERLVESLAARASELWGRERAEQVRQTIEETAAAILRVTQNPPSQEEEPAFY